MGLRSRPSSLAVPLGNTCGGQQIQEYLDRRRPGSNRHGTPRQEKDKVVFLSGLYQDDHDKLLTGSTVTVAIDGNEFQTEGFEEGYTTGEPIAAIVLSTSKKSGDYTQFTGPSGEVRPGHTDLVKYHKSQRFCRYSWRWSFELSFDDQRRDWRQSWPGFFCERNLARSSCRPSRRLGR